MNKPDIATIVSLKELRENFPEFIEKVANGQSFTVVKRSKPIFQINPVQDEGEWETVIDFTEISKNGLPVDEVLKHL